VWPFRTEPRRRSARIDNAGELDKEAITGRLDDASAMLLDLRVGKVASQSFSAARVPSSSAPINRE
jgi:hypothetical protein